jgi:hypothetical protein
VTVDKVVNDKLIEAQVGTWGTADGVNRMGFV